MIPASDYERIEAFSNAQRWIGIWHPGTDPVPPGRPHGAAGVCVTPSGEVVLISQDGEHWELPGGRPEGDETLEETLRRELMEEACAEVRIARLLGFCQSECIEGPELGLVIVRSLWRADVDLLAWEPQFEVLHRRLVAYDDALSALGVDAGLDRIICRALLEAGIAPAAEK